MTRHISMCQKSAWGCCNQSGCYMESVCKKLIIRKMCVISESTCVWIVPQCRCTCTFESVKKDQTRKQVYVIYNLSSNCHAFIMILVQNSTNIIKCFIHVYVLYWSYLRKLESGMSTTDLCIHNVSNRHNILIDILINVQIAFKVKNCPDTTLR